MLALTARSGAVGFAVLAAACATLPSISASDNPASALGWTTIDAGIEYTAFAFGEPASEVFALRVDLDSVDLVVTPGGPSFGQVIGRSVIGFAREFDCAAAVNATPFYPDSFRLGEPRFLSGVLVVDGQLLSAPAPRFHALAVSKEGSASILPQGALGDTRSLRVAVGGFFSLVKDGKVTARRTSRTPMTAVGLLEGGRRLVLVVVDGRRPGSAGMSGEEAGRLLVFLGAVDAMSFDGGGSSAMVVRGADGRSRVANLPVHLGMPPMERVVGTCIGFRSRGNP